MSRGGAVKADLVIASNRGPLSFASTAPEGRPVPAGSAGGLAGALHPQLEGSGATWVACAMSDADRQGHRRGLMTERGLAPRSRCSPTPTPTAWPTTWCPTPRLWFLPPPPLRPGPPAAVRPPLGRGLGGLPRLQRDCSPPPWPRWPHEGATVLVQDYHLCLLPELLAENRPDLQHRPLHPHPVRRAPTCSACCPSAVAREILAGDGRGHRLRIPHARAGRPASRAAAPTWASSPDHTFVSPLGPEPDAPHRAGRVAGVPGGAATRLDELLGDRRLVLRVDRIEPSRTCCGGSGPSTRCSRRPELRGAGRAAGPRLRLALDAARVPRLRHRGRARGAARVNDTWGTDDWAPIILDVADDPGRSIAALIRYDVLLVNPLRDGLNLVAKEGPLVNDDRRGPGAVARGGRVRRAAAEAALRSTPSTWPAPPRCSARPSTCPPPSGPGGPRRCGPWSRAPQARATGWPTCSAAVRA